MESMLHLPVMSSKRVLWHESVKGDRCRFCRCKEMMYMSCSQNNVATSIPDLPHHLGREVGVEREREARQELVDGANHNLRCVHNMYIG